MKGRTQEIKQETVQEAMQKMTEEQNRQIGDLVKEFAQVTVDFYNHLHTQSVYRAADEETLEYLEKQPIPKEGIPVRQVYSEMLRDIYSNTLLAQHPRSFACIPSTASMLSWMGDVKNGRKPFAVVASAGTTNTGSVDPFREIAALCQEYDMWMHVDGAFEASALLSERYRKKLDGIELSDSLSWDAHKWMMQTYGCSMVLVRNQSCMVHSFAAHPEYLKNAESQEGSIEFWDLGPELTRPARSLKLWLTLQVTGTEGMGRVIEHGCAMAEFAEKIIRESPNWKIISPAQLGIVNFRYVADVRRTEKELDTLNQEISREITESGFAQVFTTELKGKKVLRMCTINPETTRKDICDTVERLKGLAAIVNSSVVLRAVG